ncbi:MAG: TolC family protein [Lentisphaeria bacterium]|nr:TolC family protein [Lentisphaeria bacterium]
MKKTLLNLLTVLAAITLFGCKSYEDYKNERAESAVRHFDESQYRNIPADKVLTLKECIQIAVENNVDLKVCSLEEKVSHEIRTSEMLGMLPDLTVSDSYIHRDNVAASSSRQVHGTNGYGNYTYSTSQDKTINYFNIDLALSVLDFGLAFVNGLQENDRMLLRNQRFRRAAQNLVMDTSRVYFQVAAAQRAIDITEKLLAECKDTYQQIDKMGEDGKISPYRAFDEVSKFIEMEKRLTNYVRTYENSCVELRALLGLYPNASIRVDDSVLDKVPEFALPDIQLMEQIALMKRPELFEMDMQRHVNILEARKTIITMFPNVKIFYDYNEVDNSFLYHNSWREMGVRSAYNLLKLPQKISRYRALNMQIEAEEYRTYAQAIAIMAQVRIAHANLLASRERYDINARVNGVYKKNLQKTEGGNNVSGEISPIDISHMKLSTAETEIERLLALGNYYVAYFRILNTLGIENLDTATVNDIKTELDDARIRADAEIQKAREKYEIERAKKEEEDEGKSTDWRDDIIN